VLVIVTETGPPRQQTRTSAAQQKRLRYSTNRMGPGDPSSWQSAAEGHGGALSLPTDFSCAGSGILALRTIPLSERSCARVRWRTMPFAVLAGMGLPTQFRTTPWQPTSFVWGPPQWSFRGAGP